MLILDYFWWHYFVAPRNILIIFKNYSIAIWNKFLILQHAKTLFSPWHRMRAKYLFPASGILDKLGNFLFDIFIRLVAAFLRSVIIVLGLIVQAIAIVLFAIGFAVWLAWPALVFVAVGRGISLAL